MSGRFFLFAIFIFGQVALAGSLDDGLPINRMSPDSFSLRVTTPFPELKPVVINKKQMLDVNLENFDAKTEPGSPDIPHKIIHVVIPANKEIEVKTKIRQQTVNMALASEITPVKREVHDGPDFPTNSAPSTPNQGLGKQLALIEDVSFAGNARLATITIWPLSYDPKTHALGHASDFDINISFTDQSAPKDSPPVSSPTSQVLAPLVVNPWDLPAEDPSKIDLIIAHESYRNAIQHYVEFKKARGREVRLVFVNALAAAKIKETIQAEYRKTPPPSSTLLIGNIDQIPSWRGSSDNAWTDFPYQNLDAGDVPDIALGRVPAHNETELSAFLAKSIARETNPPAAGEILLTSGKDVSLGCPNNVAKVGDHIKGGDSEINLIKKFRSQGATTTEIIEAYNAAPNIIVYDGHGDHTGMVEIPLVLNNLSKLTNASYPLIFDIACLNANWSRGATRRNFAEMILLQKDYGAAGIMASGGSGYGHDFFQTIGKLSAIARKENNESKPSLLNEVGSLILAAKIKHGSEDRSFWNYYGDPASHVWPQ